MPKRSIRLYCAQILARASIAWFEHELTRTGFIVGGSQAIALVFDQSPLPPELRSTRWRGRGTCPLDPKSSRLLVLRGNVSVDDGVAAGAMRSTSKLS